MKTTTEIQALQNAANKFNLKVLEYVQTDKRKRQRYFLIDSEKNTISPALEYEKLNAFLLGMDKSSKLKKEKPSNDEIKEILLNLTFELIHGSRKSIITKILEYAELIHVVDESYILKLAKMDDYQVKAEAYNFIKYFIEFKL